MGFPHTPFLTVSVNLTTLSTVSLDGGRAAIQSKKASQSLPPAAKLCAQQTASLLSENSEGIFDFDRDFYLWSTEYICSMRHSSLSE